LDWSIVLYLLGGLAFLVIGAEGLVRGASRLAAALGISPLVIGLTIVAFGTSTPELAVSVQASLIGSTDVAIGNVVGSNIFNILFILGISALITPLIVNSQLLRLDVPLMIFVSFLMLFFSWDGSIGRVEGMVLFAGLIAYTWWNIRQSRRESVDVQEEYAQEYSAKNGGYKNILKNMLFIVIGLGLLVVGADWFVKGAVSLAYLFNVSDLVIGLTIVAVGTSLPEVATSIVAAIRQERDIAVGNVVGSNIFNILAVVGLSGLVSSDGVQVSQLAIRQDIPIMIAVAALTLPIFFTGHRIARWEGALLFVCWAAYTSYLVLISIPLQASANTVAGIMLWIILPISLAMMAIDALSERRRQSGKQAS
jgi:cation:H+ antiporter